MKKINQCVLAILALFMLFSITYAQVWNETFYDDFEPGYFGGTEVITPDPDGLDDGAIRLYDPGITLDILVVYPLTCDPHVLGPRFDLYEGEGDPPTNVRVYLIQITAFDFTTDPLDSFYVYSVETSSYSFIPLTFFEGILFGVSDVYGYEDLTTSACDLTRNYAALGRKVVIFTHSTVWNRGILDPMDHPGFNSLVDIHGLGTLAQPTYDTFNVVYNVASDPGAPILHMPFELPDTMPVSWTHRRGQVPVSGDLLYIGTGYTDYEGIYFHVNHIPAYDSWGALINYGHTLTSPIEWDVKCTINTLYLIWGLEPIFGEYVSTVFDPGRKAAFVGADWSTTLPESTGVFVALSSSPDGVSWSDYIPLTPGPIDPPIVDRYFRYRVDMFGITYHLPILHWIMFPYITQGPVAEINYPFPEAVSSCPDQEISLFITDENGVEPSSIVLEVQGITYTVDDPELSFMYPELIFSPSVYFTHAETVVVRLLEAENNLGLAMDSILEWRFFIDLEPPYATAEFPADDSILLSPPETISVELYEDYTTLVIDPVVITVNDVDFDLSHPAVDWDGATLRLAVEEASLYFGESDRVTVTVSGAHDTTDYCPPNVMEPYTWEFIITSLLFTLPDSAGHRGEILNIPLSCEELGALNVTKVKVVAEFDETIITPIGVETVGSISEGSTIEDLEIEGAFVSFSINSEADLTGAGTLVYITSEVNPSGIEGDFSPLDLVSVEINDSYAGRTEDGFFFIRWATIQWLGELHFTGTPPRVRENTLSFGAGVSAWDGYDPGIDIIAIPVVPDMVNAYFPLDDPEYSYIRRLQRDVQHHEPLPIIWTIRTEDEPAGVVRWDPEFLPAGQFLMDDIIDMHRDSIWYFGEDAEIIIEFSRPTIDDSWITLTEGWNLVSVSTGITFSANPEYVFPTIIGSPYFYTDFRYLEVTEVQKGKGYWVYSPTDTTYQVAGMPVEYYNCILSRGWNLIGALKNPISSTTLTTSPPGALIPNSCFDYNPTISMYELADTIFPWKGYWIAATQSCTLFVEAEALAKRLPFECRETGEIKWAGSFKLEDHCGENTSLKFGFGDKRTGTLIPPPVPGEVTGPHFVDDIFRLSEDYRESGRNTIWELNIPKKLDKMSWQVKFNPEFEELLLHTPQGRTIKMFEEHELYNPKIGIYNIESRFITPDDYEFTLRALPNPFNENVTIEYSFASQTDEQVQIAIYNILGEKVDELVNDHLEPGQYRMIWNTDQNNTTLPTGIYFCNFRTNKEEKTLKMLLLR